MKSTALILWPLDPTRSACLWPWGIHRDRNRLGLEGHHLRKSKSMQFGTQQNSSTPRWSTSLRDCRWVMMMSDDDEEDDDDGDDDDDEVWSTMIQGPLAKACGRTLLWTKMATGLPYDSKCCLHLLAAIQINSIRFSLGINALVLLCRVLVVIYFQAISHFQSRKTSKDSSL